MSVGLLLRHKLAWHASIQSQPAITARLSAPEPGAPIFKEPLMRPVLHFAARSPETEKGFVKPSGWQADQAQSDRKAPYADLLDPLHSVKRMPKLLTIITTKPPRRIQSRAAAEPRFEIADDPGTTERARMMQLARWRSG